MNKGATAVQTSPKAYRMLKSFFQKISLKHFAGTFAIYDL